MADVFARHFSPFSLAIIFRARHAAAAFISFHAAAEFRHYAYFLSFSIAFSLLLMPLFSLLAPACFIFSVFFFHGSPPLPFATLDTPLMRQRHFAMLRR